jgi:hypothetical protein
VFDTVTTATFVDCHVARLVMFWDAPLDSDAVAVNWLLAPTDGAVPLTDTAVTDGLVLGGVGRDSGPSPHP